MTIYNLRKHLPFRMHGLVWFKYLTTKHIVKTKQKSKILFRLITMISPGIAKQVSSFDCIVKIIRVTDYFYTKKFYKNLVLLYSFSFSKAYISYIEHLLEQNKCSFKRTIFL